MPGISRASGQARGLADPRTRLFLKTMRVIHLIHQRRGHSGWLIEKVDATDHPINSVKKDFNEVIKRLLGEGVAFDATGHFLWKIMWKIMCVCPAVFVESG
jgi:hypothetical protein